jgi:arylsulfatase A-like enzyme
MIIMETRTPRTNDGGPMRILVLVINGLQPAYLGPYGNEWVTTPFLDRWAAEGVVFDQHFADCPDPAAARQAWRRGRHPIGHNQDGDLLADLRAAGVRTARVGPSLPADDPFAAGWDIDLPAARDADDSLSLKPTRRAVRQAIEQLSGAERALLWIEIDGLLPPWRLSKEVIAENFGDADRSTEDEEGPPPKPLAPWTVPLPESIAPGDDHTFERIQTTYAAAVADLDASLGRLLADCSKRNWGKEALWILTSERGFPLGEHGAVGYVAADLFEELVHLPLMVRWPHAAYAGLRVSALTQPADVAPTLRKLCGLPPPTTEDHLSGRSLVALVRGDDCQVRSLAVGGLRRGGHVLWGIRSAEWYLMIDDSTPHATRRLYVKPDDRWDVNDVWHHNMELAEQLERELGKMLRQ